MVALAHEANCQRAQKSHHDESESGLEETGLSGQLLVVAIYIRAWARGTSMSSIACSSLSFVPDSVGAPRAVPSLRLRSHIESKGEATWATGPRRDGDSAFRKIDCDEPTTKTECLREGLAIGWAVTGSNRRPPACKAGALPAELTARLRVHTSEAIRNGRGGAAPPAAGAPDARPGLEVFQTEFRSQREEASARSFAGSSSET